MSKPQGISRREVFSAVALVPVMAVGAGSPDKTNRARSNGKVAVVTGASRGIGAATAKRLACDGFAVTINYDRSADAASALAREIQSAGGRAIAVRADVSDPKAVVSLFDANERTFGGVDVVVSNAGVMRLAPIRDMSDADFDLLIDVNQKGGFYVLREAARRVRDHGRIITLSSSITQLRAPTYGPYAATKVAQELYANILAKELAGRMISVNSMAPGVVNTPLFTDGKTPQQIAGFAERTPHKRLGEPVDIANVIAALCSTDGAWVNGQTVFANGGIV